MSHATPAPPRTPQAARAARAGRFAVAAALCGAAVGCAAAAGYTAKQNYINGYVQQHEYRQPCIYVWPAVQQVIAEQGAPIAQTSQPPFYRLETAWVPDGTGSKQYLAEAVPSSESSCRLAITKQSIWSGRTSATRELTLEFRVLSRVDPQFAASLEQNGEVVGSQARAAYEAQHSANATPNVNNGGRP